MTTADDYIARVLARMPRALPNRAHIALELRGHIAERLSGGHPLDAVLGQLGDPARLAESYLGAVPLEPAPFLSRAAAKIVDLATIVALVGPVAALAWLTPSEQIRSFAIVVALASAGFGFLAYTVVAEYWFGQTLGKRLAGLHVVAESGAPLGVGQAIVRQLPVLLQVFWIDILFALFTDRRQRAFELLSKTRVVRAAG
jgi:uncharacterized RDD family membrane protein YckC